MCIPIFFDPIVNHNALVVKPGKTDDQSSNGTSVGITIPDQEREASTADVSTVKKEVDQLPSNETNSESKKTDTTKPEGSIEKSTKSSKTDEGEKVEEKCKSSEQLSDVKNDNENPIHTLGTDSSASVNKRDEQKTLGTVNTSAKPELQVPSVTTLPTENPDDILKVHFIDVGQGDCIFIQNGEYAILIDGGESWASESIVTYLKDNKIKMIDTIIVSHPHDDHIGGLSSIIYNFKVNQIIMNTDSIATRNYINLIEAIRTRSVKVLNAYKMNSFVNGNLSAEILHPTKKFNNINNNSIVVKIIFGNKSFLFAGDAEEQEENDLLRYGEALKSDVLKAGHHGSDTSNSEAFLSKVSPDYIVISVGRENIYGHPDNITLRRIHRLAKIGVFRTDENNTIVATCDGEKITFDKLAVPFIPKKRILENYEFIGSIKSKKFHCKGCKKAPCKSINQINFSTREDAIKARYSPCKICKP